MIIDHNAFLKEHCIWDSFLDVTRNLPTGHNILARNKRHVLGFSNYLVDAFCSGNYLMLISPTQRVVVPRKLIDQEDDENNHVDQRAKHHWLGGLPLEVDGRGEP